MSHIIAARNVNDAFVSGWYWLSGAGQREESRNGPVLVAPGLVVTEYARPLERVLFHPRRDANHVFHLMEAIWMLAGRDDVEWLEQFNSTYSKYADNGKIHGAYGHRWRKAFTTPWVLHLDQLKAIANLLDKDRMSRQAVLQMWDVGCDDLTGVWKDRPCNTHVYFDCREGRLNMTVCCRSNDMLWGAYGANVVHFSILQEVMAAELRLPIGVYRQVSNNFHVYTDLPAVRGFLDTPPTDSHDFYASGMADTLPFVHIGEDLNSVLHDCEEFCEGRPTHSSEFLTTVATPLRDAYLARKRGEAIDTARIPQCDWRVGFETWLTLRSTK